MLGSVVSASRQFERNALAIAYALIMFTSNAVLTSTTSITVPLTDYYNLSSSVLSEMPNLMFAVIYVVVGFAAPWVTRKVNLYTAVCVSAVLMTTGNVFRAAAAQGFIWLLIGNALVSIAQPLIFANTSGIALLCFGCTRQGWYIGCAYLAAVIGGAWGFVVSSYLVQTASDYGYYFGRVELLYLLLDLVITICLFWICGRRWQRERQANVPIDPGQCDSNISETAVFPLENRFKVAISLLFSALLNGSTNAVVIILEPVMLSRGFTDQNVLIAGILYLVVSIPVPSFLGWWIDHTVHETPVLILVLIVTAVTQLLLVNISMSLAFFYLVITIYGIGGNGITTLFLSSSNRWSEGRDADSINSIYIWTHTFTTLLLALVYAIWSTSTTSSVFWVLSWLCIFAPLLIACF